MAQPVSPTGRQPDASAVIQDLHGLVTYGPWDLDIASAMSAYGYDAVKWAEGQSMLAELVSSELSVFASLTPALAWYDDAVRAARDALAARPQLLAKLGLPEVETQ
jgi:hypothetical protein